LKKSSKNFKKLVKFTPFFLPQKNDKLQLLQILSLLVNFIKGAFTPQSLPWRKKKAKALPWWADKTLSVF
jgi:hypothetical protein